MKHENPQKSCSSAHHSSVQHCTADNHNTDAVNTSRRENAGIPTSRIQTANNSQLGEGEHQNKKLSSRRLRPIKKFKISRARRTRLTGFFFSMVTKVNGKLSTFNNFQFVGLKMGWHTMYGLGDSHCKLTLELDLGWV